MYGLYVEKEEILSHFYRTGKFPTNNPKGGCADLNQIRYESSKYHLLNLFYLASLYAFWINGSLIFRLTYNIFMRE